MSHCVIWTCDNCHHTRPEPTGDSMPSGWCHTMAEQDLCPSCRTD